MANSNNQCIIAKSKNKFIFTLTKPVLAITV